VKQYVGIPFDAAPCWELCRKVYREQYGIALPQIGEPSAPCAELEGPVEGCLVRVVRVPPLSEHWGVYIAGYVLHAQRPASVMVPLRRFMQNHAHVNFVKVLQ